MIDRIEEIIRAGESASIEFKGRELRPESLAREMVAFANTLGGVILLGVEDSGEICGIGESIDSGWIANIARNNVNPSLNPLIEILTLSGKRVGAVTIEKGKHKPYQTIDGKFWIRVGSTNRSATKEELSRLFQQAGLIHYDISPVELTGMRDLDANRLHDYWNSIYQIDYESLEPREQERLLLNASILTEWESGIVCTVGGLLIFGTRPQKRILQSSISFAMFGGTEMTDPVLDKKELEGSLPAQVDQAVALIQLYLPRPSEVVGNLREEKIEISPKVLRELVVNAVVHRDYSIQTRKIQIFLFSDRLVVASPGRIANTLDIEKIKAGNSAPRNILLLKFMDNLRYIDGLGRGVPMVVRELKERVSFEEIGDTFRVTVRRGAAE